MTNSNIGLLTAALLIIAGIMIVLLIVLAVIYLKMRLKEKSELETNNTDKENDIKKETSKVRQYTVNSVFDFMEFDKIEDNMIIQKKGKRFIMVVECQGINYDLMSQEEKVAVEEGFSQFLNTLKEPIQLYIQTRKINLESSLKK